MDETAGQGGEAAAVDASAGTEELPPLWTWAMGCGERSPPWSRPWGRRGFAAVDEATGQGGEAAVMDTAAGTTELPLLWTWAIGCGEGLLPWTRPWGGQGGVAVVGQAT